MPSIAESSLVDEIEAMDAAGTVIERVELKR